MSPSLAINWIAVTGRATDLGSLSRHELDRMHRRAQRNLAQRKRVSKPRLRAGAGHDPLPDLESTRVENVSLLSVRVVDQRDPGRTVRIVLDLLHRPRHSVLVTAKIDLPVPTLVTATTTPVGNPAMMIPPAFFDSPSVSDFSGSERVTSSKLIPTGNGLLP